MPEAKTGIRAWLWLLFTVVATVAVDQWLKMLVTMHMELYQQIDLLPFFALYRTFNTGVAFSMLSFIDDRGLVLLSLVVIAFVLYLFYKSDPRQKIARLGFALVVGGAVGNVIDRALLGHVVDYFLFHTPGWSFAVFNLADAFISVGAALIVLDELLQLRRNKKADR
ncbi:signal peptidase II [Limoniibacter endophyticus]|uniref:Lipoprotein signal peptidase n=1 Tax=Limoniibacter endophyticus TaxID=1565040 RepID=A0A8J3DT54_9HYPH|nr:signal peptidase II [Limoniibacter endophyticus]GHC79980.1 lipoprotein signal peptidase [Limoniibacter endophyticus]